MIVWVLIVYVASRKPELDVFPLTFSTLEECQNNIKALEVMPEAEELKTQFVCGKIQVNK